MTRKEHTLRLFGSLLMGSCVSAQILALIHYGNGPNGLNLATLPYTLLLGLTYLIFMFPTALVVGLPAYFILRYRGWLNGWTIVVIGTLAGAAWVLPFLGEKPPPYDLALFFGFGGFIASGFFWLVFVRTNSALNTSASNAGAG